MIGTEEHYCYCFFFILFIFSLLLLLLITLLTKISLLLLTLVKSTTITFYYCSVCYLFAFGHTCSVIFSETLSKPLSILRQTFSDTIFDNI